MRLDTNEKMEKVLTKLYKLIYIKPYNINFTAYPLSNSYLDLSKGYINIYIVYYRAKKNEIRNRTKNKEYVE